MQKGILNSLLRQEAHFQLKNNALFGSLDTKAFDHLLDNVTLSSLKEGEVLFKQDDPANAIFLLQAGQIKLVRLSTAGNEKIIELVSAGNSFAEAVMFSDHGVFPVSAVALQETQVWCVDAEIYRGLLTESPAACFSVMAEQSRRLHELIGEIDYLTLHSASVRLLAFLLEQARDSEQDQPLVKLPYTKVVLASRLSIKPETLSRTFAKLSKDQLIRIDEGNITLLDVPRLKQLLMSG